MDLNPGARVILGSSPFSDGDAIAFTKAFDTAGRGKDLKAILPQGAEDVGHSYIRTDSRWIGSVGYFPERYGKLVIPAAIALAQGKKVPKEVLTVHEVVDLSNIDRIYPVKK
jgi:ribose transport system substrate-binding protein